MKRLDDRIAAGLLALIWIALFLYIDPRGDFPLNDDFQYAESVRRWASGGGFHLSQWGLSTSVTHLAMGRLFSLFCEPTNWHLRLLMLGVGFLGVLLFYFFLRSLEIEVAAALAGAALLAVNPIYLTMSASFHLDVTATVLLIAATCAFNAALRERSVRLMSLCSALVGLGFLTRQTALFSLLGGLWALRKRKLLAPDLCLALIMPAAAAALGFSFYLRSLPSLPWAWQTQLPAASATHSWFAAFGVAGASILTASLFLIPLAFGQIKKSDGNKSALTSLATLSVALILLLGALGGRLPSLGNTLSLSGLGVVTLTAAQSKVSGFWGVPRLWRALDFAAGLAAGLLLLPLTRRGDDPDGRGALSNVLLFGLPPYAATLLFSLNFDRYLLAVLPFLISAVLLKRRRPLDAFLFALNCGALAMVSMLGLRDYFSWNRARWEAGQSLVRLGVAPERIENGFDWDGQYTLDRNMNKLLSEKPAKGIGMWDWMNENKVVAITSFSDKPPKEGFKLLNRFPYETPLSRGTAFVYLYGDERAFTRR